MCPPCNGVCQGGHCIETLARGGAGVSGLAVDDAYIYWTNYSTGDVLRLALADVGSGGAPQVIAGGQRGPQGASVQGDNLYWANWDDGKIVSARIAGLVAGSVEDPSPDGAAPDADVPETSVSEAGMPDADVPDASVPDVIAAGQTSPIDIASDGISVYWANGYGPHSIQKAPLAGLSPGMTATAVISWETSPPNCLTLDRANLYWANVAGEVRTAPLAGLPLGGAPSTIRTIAPLSHAIAVDASYLYWAAFRDGMILRVPLATPDVTPTMLANGQDRPNALFVDDTYVYWGNYGGGEIRRTRK